MNYSKIKNLLNIEDNEPLPSNLDWDNVEMGILEVMHSLDDKLLSKKEDKCDRNKLLLIFFLVLACLLGLLYLSQRLQTLEEAIVHIDKKQLNESGSTRVVQHTLPIAESSWTGDTRYRLSGDNTVVDTNTNVMSNAKVDNSQLSTQITSQSHVRTSFTSSKSTTPLSSADLFSNATQGLLPTFKQNDGTNNRTTHNNELPSSLQSSSLTKVKSQIGSEHKESLIVPTLPMINLKSFALESRYYSWIDIKPVQQVTQSKEKFIKSIDRLIWESSLLHWNEGYGNTKPERESYEVTLPSLQLQFNYVIGLKNSYFTQIGLQYQQLESRLNFDTTIEDYTKVTLTDTIIQVQNNLVSGEQSATIGDVEVPVDAQRRVVHHNTNKLFMVSAAIGRTWRYKALTADTYIGIGLGKRISSTGRTLLKDTIIDYAGTNNEFLNNQIIVDGTIGLRLQYSLSPKIGITSGINLQKSLSNWSNELGVIMRPTVVSFQLGLGYSF